MNKYKLKKYAGYGAVYFFLISILCVTLYPILYIVFGSFKTNQELVSGGTGLLPEKFMFQNYADAWYAADFATYTMNSVWVSGAIAIGVLFVASMTGYVFARKDFFCKKLLFNTIMAFMFINVGSATLRPLLGLAVDFNLHNSLIGVVIISIGTQQATNIFLVNGYIKSLPKELDEAAIIDGCSFFQIYYLIILPLLKPIMATIALLTFKAGWNEYILPLMFSVANPKLRTLTVGVLALRNMEDGAAAWHIMFAGSAMSILPIILIYLFASKYFVSGLSAGAVKG